MLSLGIMSVGLDITFACCVCWGGLTAAVTLSAREYISMSVVYLVGSLNLYISGG